MRVRITAVDGYTLEVPKDDSRFTWMPPSDHEIAQTHPLNRGWLEKNRARVYADVNSLEELKTMVRDYGKCALHIRTVGDDDDIGMLELCIYHDCYSN